MAGVLRAYPDSDRAFGGYQFAAGKLRNWEAVEDAARQRLERSPNDERAIVSQAAAASAQGNFAKSLELLRTQASNPKAQIDLLNNYAWNGLFVSPAPTDMVEIGQRAARLTDNKSFSVLHTLAAVYAEIGRPAEARKLILAAMDEIGLEEPDEVSWYVFGRIAEQYGQTDAALAAYRRVRPKEPEDPLATNSTWALAQRRAKLMGASLD